MRILFLTGEIQNQLNANTKIAFNMAKKIADKGNECFVAGVCKENISINDLSEEIEETQTTEDIICEKEEKLKLFKDMQKLDEQSKEVMYLRMVGNLNFIEIGEILGKTPNWARVTFYRAKQKIREVNKNGKKN